jgi:hypothetical protein
MWRQPEAVLHFQGVVHVREEVLRKMHTLDEVFLEGGL